MPMLKLIQFVGIFALSQYMEELRASVGDTVQMWDHYEVMNKSHVDISNFGEYFIAAIETLLISQRKLHVKVSNHACHSNHIIRQLLFVGKCVKKWYK